MKFQTIDRVGKVKNVPKMTAIGKLRRHMRLLVYHISPLPFLNGPSYQMGQPIWTYNGSNDAVWPRKGLMGSLSVKKLMVSSYSLKPPIFRPGKGISCINSDLNNFTPVRTISAKNTSIDAVDGKKLKPYQIKISENWSRRIFPPRSLSKWSFPAQMPHSVIFQWHSWIIQAVTRPTLLGKWNRIESQKCQNFNQEKKFSRKFTSAKNQNVCGQLLNRCR